MPACRPVFKLEPLEQLNLLLDRYWLLPLLLLLLFPVLMELLTAYISSFVVAGLTGCCCWCCSHTCFLLAMLGLVLISAASHFAVSISWSTPPEFVELRSMAQARVRLTLWRGRMCGQQLGFSMVKNYQTHAYVNLFSIDASQTLHRQIQSMMHRYRLATWLCVLMLRLSWRKWWQRHSGAFASGSHKELNMLIDWWCNRRAYDSDGLVLSCPETALWSQKQCSQDLLPASTR